MKKSLLVLLTVLVLASMVLTACGGEEPAAPAAEEAAAEAPAEGAPAASGDVVAAFKFSNSGAVDFCELYVSPTGVEEWGEEQLQGSTLPAGGEFTLKNIPAGRYDIKVVGCDGTTENVIPDVAIVNQ